MKIVSIIVPTFNRIQGITDCLESMRNQTYPSDLFETIVVDDGSSDGTLDFLKQYCDTHPGVRYVACEHGGPAGARNAGTKLAEGEWLAFTDDDCLPSPTWLESAAAHFDNPDISIIEGRTVAESTDLGVLDRTMDVTDGGGYVTCNIFYRKTALEQIGGFDPGFPTYREDTDLAWRLLDSDVATRGIFEDNAIVTHRTNHYSVSGLLRQAFRLKRAYYEARLCKQHRKRYRKRFAFLGYFNPTTILTFPMVLSTALAICCGILDPSVPCLLLGLALILYAYCSTVVLYFSIHGGVRIGRMMRDLKSMIPVLCVWWLVLVAELVWGVFGALRFRVILF